MGEEEAGSQNQQLGSSGIAGRLQQRRQHLLNVVAECTGPQRALHRDILLEIDWQGAQQVRRLFGDTVGIFILPPSIAELERRMRRRGQDSDAVIRRRLAVAADEMSHAAEFEYVIINNDFEEARRDLIAVVRASRLVYSRQLERYPDVFKL